jgi:hypothetical protein
MRFLITAQPGQNSKQLKSREEAIEWALRCPSGLGSDRRSGDSGLEGPWQICCAFADGPLDQARNALLLDIVQGTLESASLVDSGLVPLLKQFRPPSELDLWRCSRIERFTVGDADGYSGSLNTYNPLFQERM